MRLLRLAGFAGLAGTLVVAASCGSAGGRRTAPSTTSTPSTTAKAAPGTWSPIPAAPGQADGAPVWTGSEFVLWSGGRNVVSDGAAYRTATGAWRTIAHSPLSPRRGHTAVWTGHEIVYWGGVDSTGHLAADGAAYDPALDRWQPLPRAPLSARAYHQAVWTGREMVVWGGETTCCAIDSVLEDATAAAYDPAARRWRPLPALPAPWSGDGGPAATGVDGGRVLVWRADRVAALDPGGSAWTPIGGAAPVVEGNCSVTGGPVAQVAFTAAAVVVWRGGCQADQGWRLDVAGGRWSALGPSPGPGLSSLLVVGDRVYGAVPAADGTVLETRDAGTGSWTDLRQPAGVVGSGPLVLAAGNDIIVWGGYRANDQARTGLVYHAGAVEPGR